MDDSRLEWALFDDIGAALKVAAEYDLLVGFGLRLDGGPHKPRRLIPGSSVVYCLDWKYFGHKHTDDTKAGLSRDLADSPCIADTSQKCYDFLAMSTGDNRKSGDTSHNDEDTPAEDIIAILMVLAKLYSVPEQIAVFLTLANAFKSYVDGTTTKIVNRHPKTYIKVKPHVGGNASGMGPSFVAINEIRTYAAEQFITEITDGTAQPTIVYGDDRTVLSAARESTRSSLFLEYFNIHAKVAAQHDSTAGFCMCRRVFLDDRERPLPIMYSIIRNAICPEHKSIMSMTPEEIAASRRAASLNLAHGMNDRFFQPLKNLWYKHICPEQTLLFDRYPTDEELMNALPYHARSLREELYYALMRI
jgi:hypothetical protein